MNIKLVLTLFIALSTLTIQAQTVKETNFVPSKAQLNDTKYFQVITKDSIQMTMVIKFSRNTPKEYMEFAVEVLIDNVKGMYSYDLMADGFPPIEHVEYIMILTPIK